MNTKVIVILGGVVALGLSVLIFPRLARHLDSTVGQRLETSAAHEAQYREMTSAYPFAGELLPDHPTHKLWRETRASLFEAGYIETREFPLRPLTARGAVNALFASFHKRFPGVECSVRAAKSDAPVLVVTARKSDFRPFGEIERFASQYGQGK